MVQIKLSLVFVLAAAVITPVLPLPVENSAELIIARDDSEIFERSLEHFEARGLPEDPGFVLSFHNIIHPKKYKEKKKQWKAYQKENEEITAKKEADRRAWDANYNATHKN